MPVIYFEEMYPELGCPKPTPSSQSLPKWWKDIPKYDGHDSSLTKYNGRKLTIRSCPAIEDSLFSGYTLYLPSDVYVDASKDEIEFWIPNNFIRNGLNIADYIQKHENYVTKGYEHGNIFHSQSMKWNPFWGIKTEQGFSALFTHPFHRMDLPFHSVTAIVDTDSFTTRNPYAFFIKKGFSGVISRGTPILNVFPFQRNDWESKTINMNFLEREQHLSLISSVFSQAYKKIFWSRKKYK